MLDHCPSRQDLHPAQRRRATRSPTARKSEQNVDVAGIDPAWHEIENRAVIARPAVLADRQRAGAGRSA